MTSLLRDPGCTCDLTATLSAAVEGEPEPLCDVHDADTIAERLQSEIEARMARTEMITDTVRRAFGLTEPDAPATTSTEQSLAHQDHALADRLGAEIHNPNH